MRISTLWYCIRQGVKNIGRNRLFSLASVATITASIFLFCLFYSIIINFQYIISNAESTVGITVFFDETYTEAQIKKVGDEIGRQPEIAGIRFVSAEEAWENFKDQYFGDMRNLAAGFEEDNPLAGSASYELFLNDIVDQENFVTYLKSLDGVRKVNYSSVAAAGLENISRMISYLSVVVIGILLCVSIFLISNTITVAINIRKDEIRIMKLIGAANFMVRAPFVVEGVIIGLLGALIPLAAIYYLYGNAVRLIIERFNILSNLIVFLPISEVAAVMVPVSLLLGAGIGLVGSVAATRKHLKV